MDLLTGANGSLGILPRQSLGFAITDRWLYATNSKGSDVWMIDRHRGTLLTRLPVGSRPVGIGVSPN